MMIGAGPSRRSDRTCNPVERVAAVTTNGSRTGNSTNARSFCATRFDRKPPPHCPQTSFIRPHGRTTLHSRISARLQSWQRLRGKRAMPSIDSIAGLYVSGLAKMTIFARPIVFRLARNMITHPPIGHSGTCRPHRWFARDSSLDSDLKVTYERDGTDGREQTWTRRYRHRIGIACNDSPRLSNRRTRNRGT